jgi:predicted RecB family nuclease
MCARRVHNDFDQTIPRVHWEPSPEIQRLLDEGVAFEADILADLTELLGADFVRIEPHLSRGESVRLTLEAMSNGALLISNGWLPDDHAGGRQGRPDLLLRMVGSDGATYYVPGDIKAHKTLKDSKTKSALLSLPHDPATRFEAPALVEEVAGCLDDFLQLAHYSRMIDAAGHGPAQEAREGFIIGTDEVGAEFDAPFVFTWHELTSSLFQTYSASEGKKKRSALERYDHEHGFRLKVAMVAAERTGAPTDPQPLVEPIGQDECLECPYEEYCGELLDGQASLEITSGRLSIREWLTLQALGVTSTSELAQVDLADTAWVAGYLDRIPHQRSAEARLIDAVTRARMIEAGVSLARTHEGSITIPSADVEIDFDIEWDTNEQVYLWGARIRSGQDDMTADYVPFVDWEALEDGGYELATQFAEWLRSQIEQAVADGKSLAVYHYTSPEVRFLRNLLGQRNIEDLEGYFFDLHAFVKEHFFGVEGIGLKKVATALGFEWSDDDPGGLQSQAWLQVARDSNNAEYASMRERILAYNKDDVAATAAVRDRISEVTTMVNDLVGTQ